MPLNCRKFAISSASLNRSKDIIRARTTSRVLAKQVEWIRPHFVASRCFSSEDQSAIFFEGPSGQKHHWCVHPDLKPYIRASLASATGDAANQTNGDMFLCFLGTGAGRPSVFRSNSATVLRAGGEIYLFDAGEGVQVQFMRSRLNMGDIRKVFITHMHGDHVFGLPGLLLQLQDIARVSPSNKKRILQVYGPVGIYNLIAATLSLSGTELRHYEVEVYEMTGGRTRFYHPGAERNYIEFKHRGLKRKFIPQNTDGTWTLCEAIEISTPEQARRMHSKPGGLYVRAAEVNHVPKLQCFGFSVEEASTLPRVIDVEKAQQLGVKPGHKYKLLKSGFPVISDDGSREVLPDEVLKDGILRPRKISIIGDCSSVPDPMIKLCRDSDVLVHEATLSEHTSSKRGMHGEHSTPAIAGRVASLVRAKTLFMNHISQSTFAYRHVKPVIQEAEAALSWPSRVQMCYDHLEVFIPRSGFQMADQHSVVAGAPVTKPETARESPVTKPEPDRESK